MVGVGSGAGISVGRKTSRAAPWLFVTGHGTHSDGGEVSSSGVPLGRRLRIGSLGEFKMESQQLRLCGIGQLFTEFLLDTRVPRVEVIYPQPRHVVKVPPMLDCVGSLGSKAKCNLPAQQGDNNNLNFFDIFFNKDETGDDQTGFFCGTPPVRTDNPMVWDSFFTKENLAFSPTIIHESRGQPRVEQNQQFIVQHKTRIGFSEHYQHKFCS
ncbi:hypothetical protein ZIOFF_039209 [Zingiber officinale]|uniref:Uncharacterized protein n=2 Tax=Zingiber officinale TaxID=94328 RepID=A0A8J5GB07_ZINOF|nr:hypothetical protein ZIOFF_039209 [Zingiber officinale]